MDFLKSITFHEGDANAAHSSTAEPPPAAAGLPQWDVPGGWQEQPPTQMVLAKFLVAGDAGKKAEITVSSFPGDTGGLLANVNRWRGQIGLEGVGEAELAKLVTSLDASGGKATLVDMTGTSKATGKQVRLLGVIVPRGGSTWFYKMLGDESVAEREKAAFIKFVQTVRYPNV